MSNQDFEQASLRRRKSLLDVVLLERLAETGFLATEFGLHEQAERIFSCFARLKPDKPAPSIALAIVQARRGRMQPAIASLRDTIARHPQSELARAILGSMLLHIGDPEGRELLEAVVARDLDSDAVNVALGYIDRAHPAAAPIAEPTSGNDHSPVEYFRHYNVRA